MCLLNVDTFFCTCTKSIAELGQLHDIWVGHGASPTNDRIRETRSARHSKTVHNFFQCQHFSKQEIGFCCMVTLDLCNAMGCGCMWGL